MLRYTPELHTRKSRPLSLEEHLRLDTQKAQHSGRAPSGSPPPRDDDEMYFLTSLKGDHKGRPETSSPEEAGGVDELVSQYASLVVNEQAKDTMEVLRKVADPQRTGTLPSSLNRRYRLSHDSNCPTETLTERFSRVYSLYIDAAAGGLSAVTFSRFCRDRGLCDNVCFEEQDLTQLYIRACGRANETAMSPATFVKVTQEVAQALAPALCRIPGGEEFIMRRLLDATLSEFGGLTRDSVIAIDSYLHLLMRIFAMHCQSFGERVAAQATGGLSWEETVAKASRMDLVNLEEFLYDYNIVPTLLSPEDMHVVLEEYGCGADLFPMGMFEFLGLLEWLSRACFHAAHKPHGDGQFDALMHHMDASEGRKRLENNRRMVVEKDTSMSKMEMDEIPAPAQGLQEGDERHRETLRPVFQYFCRVTGEEEASRDYMSAAKFYKFVREADLIDKHVLTQNRVDRIFIDVMKTAPPTQQLRMTFPLFYQAVVEIAKVKFEGCVSTDDAMENLLSCALSTLLASVEKSAAQRQRVESNRFLYKRSQRNTLRDLALMISEGGRKTLERVFAVYSEPRRTLDKWGVPLERVDVVCRDAALAMGSHFDVMPGLLSRSQYMDVVDRVFRENDSDYGGLNFDDFCGLVFHVALEVYKEDVYNDGGADTKISALLEHMTNSDGFSRAESHRRAMSPKHHGPSPAPHGGDAPPRRYQAWGEEEGQSIPLVDPEVLAAPGPAHPASPEGTVRRSPARSVSVHGADEMGDAEELGVAAVAAELKDVYSRYCTLSGGRTGDAIPGLTARGLVRLCKETRLLEGAAISVSEVDIQYSKVIQAERRSAGPGARVHSLTYPMFVRVLTALAIRCNPKMNATAALKEVLKRVLVLGSGTAPPLSSTRHSRAYGGTECRLFAQFHVHLDKIFRCYAGIFHQGLPAAGAPPAMKMLQARLFARDFEITPVLMENDAFSRLLVRVAKKDCINFAQFKTLLEHTASAAYGASHETPHQRVAALLDHMFTSKGKRKMEKYRKKAEKEANQLVVDESSPKSKSEQRENRAMTMYDGSPRHPQESKPPATSGEYGAALREELHRRFVHYCQFGERMNTTLIGSHKWKKMMLECDIFEQGDVNLDLIYIKAIRQVKGLGSVRADSYKMDFDCFLAGLELTAGLKFPNMPGREGVEKLLYSYILPLAHRVDNQGPTVEHLIDPDVVRLYHSLDSSLRAVFSHYAHRSQATENQEKMDESSFFRFLKEFDLIPDLLSYKGAKAIYTEAAATAVGGFNTSAVDPLRTSTTPANTMIGFNEWLDTLTRVAVMGYENSPLSSHPVHVRCQALMERISLSSGIEKVDLEIPNPHGSSTGGLSGFDRVAHMTELHRQSRAEARAESLQSGSSLDISRGRGVISGLMEESGALMSRGTGRKDTELLALYEQASKLVSGEDEEPIFEYPPRLRPDPRTPQNRGSLSRLDKKVVVHSFPKDKRNFEWPGVKKG